MENGGGLVKAKYYFKVFGLAVDEDGSLDYGYIAIGPVDDIGEALMIDVVAYKITCGTYRKLMADQLDIAIEQVEPITEAEYLDETSENAIN